MAYTTINKHTQHFDTKLHDGTGVAKTLAYDFEVDMFFTKMRNYQYPPMIFDAVRGSNYRLRTHQTNGSSGAPNTVSFGNSSGISLGTDTSSYGVNMAQHDGGSTATYVGWGWKANGAGSSNTDGTITSTVSANTTAGFSIVKYTGTGSSATIGHGLGVAPACIIFKDLSASVDWFVYHQSTGATNRTKLNQTVASSASTFIDNTAPSSTVFNTEGGGATGTSGNDFIAYCFAEKKGYSKFGSYTGNGSTDGTFVYTGFKPAWVMVKRTDSTSDWLICDNKRPGFNPIDDKLFANTNQAEDPYEAFDFVSNGFKITSSGTGHNASGSNMIYIALAESPFVTSGGIPTTAR